MLAFDKLRLLTRALLLTGASALACAQTAPRADSAQRAPGVTRAVEHPDTAVDQTQPDDRQPETATDTTPGETAKDDQKLKPETATDTPKRTPEQKAADGAKQGVQSNSPRPAKPQS